MFAAAELPRIALLALPLSRDGRRIAAARLGMREGQA